MGRLNKQKRKEKKKKGVNVSVVLEDGPRALSFLV